MDRNEIARIFNDSYERIAGASKEGAAFFAAFYDHLIASSPEAAAKLQHTDMDKQLKMMHASVFVLLAYYSNDSATHLRKLAERHGEHGVDIPAALYSIWLECLIDTVRRFDPKYSDDVGTAWRRLFEKGIEFMASHRRTSQ